MSIKSQKTKVIKNEVEMIEEEKDPMLRSLQKKVRNINKKLN
jgi:uncharacterized protein Yka (UPF0111/DUF47 family)